MSKKRIVVVAVVVLMVLAAIVFWRGNNTSAPAAPSSSAVSGTATPGGGAASVSVAVAEGARGSSRPSPTEITAQGLGTMAPELALVEAHALSKCLRLANRKLTVPEGLTQAQTEQFLKSSGALDANCPPDPDPYRVYALVEHAAEAGDLQAQLDFSLLAAGVFDLQKAALDTDLITRYKRDSMRYLEHAAKAGSVEALSRLSENYDTGLFTPADPLQAYAYGYARHQLVNSPISALRLGQLGRGLSPSQIKQGQAIGAAYVQTVQAAGVKK